MTTFPHLTPSDIAALEEDQRYYDAVERCKEKPIAIELTRGEIVTMLRKRKGLTKSQLAKKTGLSRNYIGMIESGEADNLSERVLFALADALGVEVVCLIQRPENLEANDA